MNLSLTAEQIEIQNWAKALANEIILPRANEHSRNKISTPYLEQLSRAHLMSLLIPTEWGGMGLDPISFALAIMEFSKACGSTGVTIAVTNMIADILTREGSAAQKEKYLKQLVSGESLTASFCLTENSSGSDARAMKTRAKKTKSGYELTGEKIYVTNGAFSKFFLVMGKTENETAPKADSSAAAKPSISAFLVDRSSDGVHFGKEEDKMGLIGSSTIRMSFEGVKVSEDARVQAEGEGFKIAMRALDGGRISVASQAVGIAEAAIEAAIQYSKQREQFGKPISEFQAIQWKIADSITSLSASKLLIFRAAYLKGQKRSFSREASMAKLFATEASQKAAEEALQIHGGYGYTKDYAVERYFRDLRVTSLYEGTSEIQRLVIARELLA